ncbi:hypothetical protein [Xanthobacter autotrophicus]|uniref:hypothetical protein n=1 Tax=Xanthobacter autotrophicus TaxID=280 RepID=UPI00372AA2A8
MLDRTLARNGHDVTLRRYSGAGEARAGVDVTVRAAARGYRPQEVNGGIVQGGTTLVVSPTQIVAAGWPGPQDWPGPGDWVVVGGREQRISAAPVIRIGDTVVRIDIEVEG